MVKKEIAQRLFYVDNKYHHKINNDKKLEEIKNIIDNIKKEVMALPLEEIKKRVGANIFLERLEGKYCKLVELELNRFCVCDIHQLQFRTPYTYALRGELFVNIIEKDLNLETAKRVNSIKQIVNILIKEMPPIVREYGEKFEVLMGNHRIISLIQDGKKTCKVLCLCEEHEAQDFPNLKFN